MRRGELWISWFVAYAYFRFGRMDHRIGVDRRGFLLIVFHKSFQEEAECCGNGELKKLEKRLSTFQSYINSD